MMPSEKPVHEARDDATVNEIVARGPRGAFAVAGVATAIVVLLYFAFYVFVYLPRGAVQ
jgi:hypothetical protein